MVVKDCQRLQTIVNALQRLSRDSYLDLESLSNVLGMFFGDRGRILVIQASKVIFSVGRLFFGLNLSSPSVVLCMDYYSEFLLNIWIN